MSPPLDEAVKDRLRWKFQINFVIAKEYLPFTKYPALHELEEHHDVYLRQAYKTRESASKLVHYIAESQRQDLHHNLSSHHFYSGLMDGSVDKGKIENELFVILFCQKVDELEEIRSSARFFCVFEPRKADADGLIKCLSSALHSMGIEDI